MTANLGPSAQFYIFCLARNLANSYQSPVSRAEIWQAIRPVRPVRQGWPVNRALYLFPITSGPQSNESNRELILDLLRFQARARYYPECERHSGEKYGGNVEDPLKLGAEDNDTHLLTGWSESFSPDIKLLIRRMYVGEAVQRLHM
jgi:hypothetical protein